MKRNAESLVTHKVWSGRLIRAQWMIFALVFGVAVHGKAETCDYTVTSLADSGAGSLRAGIATAPTTNDICFNVQGTINLLSPLEITQPLTITGSSGVTISGNNQVGIFVVNIDYYSSSNAVNISGLTLSAGNATAGNNIYGGAMWVQSGSVTLTSMTITGNTAEHGGALYNESVLTVQNSTITNNTASTGEGGGIENNGGTLTLSNTTVSGNTSTTASGGGLDNLGSTQITGGTFQGNTGTYGGAINNESYGTLTVSGGTTFSSNTASLDGGAIENTGTANITAALFNANQSQGNSDSVACGGAICNESTLAVTESTFVANTTTGGGGGIESDSGTSLTLEDVTITGNSAEFVGSGLYLGQSSSPPIVANTVIAGNAAIQGQTNPDCYGCTAQSGDLIGGTANLGPLAKNGGPTLTMMPLPGGNLVGLGVPSETGDATDQRGFSRLAANESIDIGAVQSHYSSVSYLTQPSNTLINHTITPPVAVQVIEVDGSTTNYPSGVPVTISLIPPDGVQATLSGTLTQLPTVTDGVTSAMFPDLSVNTAGTFQIFATDAVPGNSSSSDPAYNSTSSSFQITEPTVSLSWQPAPITYGPMPASELNATATVNGNPGTGTFVYTFVATGATINVGQTYPAAAYSVQVAFTPTGTADTYTLGTILLVTQATPVLSWATPAPIYTSTALSGTQLDATAAGITGATLPGSFVYTPAAGTMLTAGQHMLSTTFTPTDTTDYLTATTQVPIQVNAPTASTVAIQESANPITFGQSETFTAVVTGTDGNPFSGGTAAFTVDGNAVGSAAVVNGSATVTDANVPGGTHQVGLTYTNGSQTLTGNAPLTVNKATPHLSWATPAPIYTTTALSGTQLDATAAGVTGAALAGTFAYTPAAGTMLTAGPHVLSTTFTPTDAVDYATNTAQTTIQVNAPTASTVVIQESANPITFGQSETFTAVVTGTDGNPLSGGTAAFTVDGIAIGSAPVTNGTAAVTDAALTGGAHTIGVTYTNPVTNQTLTATAPLTVNKATPKLVWATPAPIYTSTALSATQLDAAATGVTNAALAGAFVYTPAAGTKLTAGPHVLSTVFTPTDAVDYATNTAQVTLQVIAPTASTVAIQESANPITFGQSETFTAVVTGTDGNPLTGGTAAFSVDGTVIGSAPVSNGTAVVTDATLTGGAHTIGVTYTNTITNQTLTATAPLTVNKATPKLVWATPAPIYTSTALSATQLDAAATGVTNAALAGAFVYTPAAGTKLTAGPHVLSTVFTPTDTVDYATNTAQVTLQVIAPTASTVAIQESANPITFGQSETFTAVVTGTDGNPLTGGTAAFTVDGIAIGSAPVTNGTAAVTDAALTGGAHTIGVTYTNPATNQTLTATAPLTVNKATPKLVWATPAPIYTSTALSATQLDAAATGVTNAALAGAFVYTPAAGTKLTAGPHVLSTVFTPTDAVDYATNTAQVTLQVNAPTASTVVIQESANPITFGQSETFTAVVTGSDGNPLTGGTAAFTVDGIAIGSAPVTNGTAAVTDAALTGGAHTIGVTYTNPATNQTLTATAPLTVNKATPKLVWATPASIYTTTALSATQLDAAATGVTNAALAGAFVYTPAAGTKLTAGPHVLSTVFTPADTVDYATNTAQVTLQVNAPTASTVVIQESASPITFGQSETFTALVKGTDGNPLSGGIAAFTVDGTAIGSSPVTNGTAAVTDAALTGGAHTIGVTYTNPATNQTLTATAPLTVNKATPKLVWATPAPIYTSTALSATQLDAAATGVTNAALAGAFVYTPAAGTKLTAGPHVLSTVFTPTDGVDYATNTAQVTLQVIAPTASTVAIQESANPITFGQSETFTALVTGTDGNPLSGGTAAFTVDGIAIGSSPVTNGTAAVTDAALTGGAHTIGVTYTNPATNQTLTATAPLTVNKATPKLVWATPAPIYTSTALSATQLDAAATGVTNAALAGAFVYTPAAGTKLTAGPHVLSTVFTPADTVDYATNTAQVTLQVNAPTASTVVIQESANPITFGQSETFTAVVTGSDGNPLTGGTAAFTVDGTAIGSAPIINGTAAVADGTLTGGAHTIGATYTNTATNQTLTATAPLTVNKATPKLTWATPAPIYTSTALSASQLDAAATGVANASLAGAFVYTPTAGTKLTAGPHVLSTVFTPTDTVDYATNTAQVTLQVNAPTASTVVILESASPITFGQSETFTAVVTGTDGNPLSGGTATFTVDGTAIGSVVVVNGNGAVTDTSLTAGTHQISATYASTGTTQTLIGTASLTVNKATPVLAWATPAPISNETPLSAAQLDATAVGVTGATLPGAFAYTPAAGTVLTQGAHVLSAAFTPTDAADYLTATAQVTVSVGYAPLTISSATPSTVALSANPTTVSITGSGFASTTVAELNGVALPTTVNNATTLTTTIAPSVITAPGAFNLTVYDSVSKLTSNALTFTVTAPPADLTVSVPPDLTSGEQPVIGLVLNTAYPTPLTGTMTLTFTPSISNGVDDPAVQFGTGGRTLTFTVPAGSTTTPQVALQTGTVAGTINVALALTADGVDVTPAGVSPITLVIAPAAPVITSVTFTNDGTGKLTVMVSGFSNTRDMSEANFVFTGAGADSLSSSTVSLPAATLFTPWYTSTTSDPYGSEFTYTQIFQLSSPDSGITGLSVTLANSIGTSGSVNSQ